MRGKEGLTAASVWAAQPVHSGSGLAALAAAALGGDGLAQNRHHAFEGKPLGDILAYDSLEVG